MDVDLDTLLEEHITLPNRGHHNHRPSTPLSGDQGAATPSVQTAGPLPEAVVVPIQQAAPSPLDHTASVVAANQAAAAPTALNVVNAPPVINAATTDPSVANPLNVAVESIDKPALQNGAELKDITTESKKSEGAKESNKNTKDEEFKKEKKETKDTKKGKDNKEPKEKKGEEKDKEDNVGTKDKAGASKEVLKEDSWSKVILGVKSFANSIGSAVSDGFSKMKAVVTGDPHANEQHGLNQEPRPLP